MAARLIVPLMDVWSPQGSGNGTWGHSMNTRVRLRDRARYWFDNTMSRGTISLIGWLAVASAALIVTITLAMVLVANQRAARRRRQCSNELWDTFRTAFSLASRRRAAGACCCCGSCSPSAASSSSAPWSVCSPVASTSGLEQLRKGRSRVIETGHTVILGWSDQVFTVVSELVEANRSRRRPTVVILAEKDKVSMEDRLRHRLETTRNTRVVCRTGSPLDLTDLEMVNLNGARSIIVLAPEGATAEDADAYVLKTLLAINRGPTLSSADRTTSLPRSGTAPTERWLAWPAATRSSSTATTSAPASSCRPRGSPGCRLSTTICLILAVTSSIWFPSRAWPGRASAQPSWHTASAVRSGSTTPTAPPGSTRPWTR